MPTLLRFSPALLALALAAAPVRAQETPPAPKPMVLERLYFGRDMGGGGTVSHRQWREFVDGYAAPRLPGLTAWAALGTWKSGNAVVSESTFVMEVVHPGDAGARAALDSVAAEYARRFGQQSVLRLSGRVDDRSWHRDPPTTPAPAPAAGPEVAFLAPPGDWPYPFSPAVRVGDLLFVSGQIGSRREADGRVVLVPGGIEAETRQTLDNVREILERSGSSMARVVKCTVMMADMAEWPRMNVIYATYFPGPKPARSALGANGLALGARVEIECIAAVGRG